MRLNHLYLEVRDLAHARVFDERWFGFDAGPAEWQAETFVIRNEDGFALALTPVETPVVWPQELHFGFLLDDVSIVRDLRARMVADGVPITDSFDEPGFALFKCHDPDGYLIEVEACVPGPAGA